MEENIKTIEPKAIVFDKDFDDAYNAAEKNYFSSAIYTVDSFEDDVRQCCFGKGFAAGSRYGYQRCFEEMKLSAWHDIKKEKPSALRLLIVEQAYYRDENGNPMETPLYGYHICYAEYLHGDVTRWAYLEDVLPIGNSQNKTPIEDEKSMDF